MTKWSTTGNDVNEEERQLRAQLQALTDTAQRALLQLGELQVMNRRQAEEITRLRAELADRVAVPDTLDGIRDGDT